jgi:hypothetical protein
MINNPPKQRPVPEIIDTVFAKTSQNARFLLSENERFGLVFVKTGSINLGTVQCTLYKCWKKEVNLFEILWYFIFKRSRQ